ncbi:MAG: mechanosensitive ion channel [Gammaproteobacteria bacterium]|nr:mechanosensitive ion channel [Gammaproteobacteria bacterium]MBV9619665.1 mechanosensitive ion channel [Gammaproteobacteria bacterium]
MSLLHKSLLAGCVVLLVVVLYGLWRTEEAPAPVHTASSAPVATDIPQIDEGTFLTAQRLARLATTVEEQPLAAQAVQLADHELDLAFSGALRAIEAHPPVLSEVAQHIQQRLQAAQKQVASDTENLNRLKSRLAQANDAEKPALQDQLELLQSQLELEQDEVEEANNDLLQAGGNVHQRIQLAQQEHEAALHNANAVVAATPPSPLAILNGMVGQTRQWWSLQQKRGLLQAARARVLVSITQLSAERGQLAEQLAATKQQVPAGSAGGRTPPASAPADADGSSLVALTKKLAADQRRLTLRDQRVTARRRLAEVYAKWEAVVAGQARSVLHAMLIGAAVVLGVLVLLLIANHWLSRLLGRASIDRRQVETLRSVTGVALQILGVVVIIFVLIGMPGQLGTMLGLAGAGLTVALKDFIVAFIGWFVLMGRNGMRLGDWVEINGVTGEVVELGMFHTVLLETGNWTDAGHPTGRHVTFTNSFATEGHYFNFSTSGQWLWDELTIVVPFGQDAHAIADALQKEVTAATADSTRQAEEEWRRSSRGARGTQLSAQPGIAVRPAAGGVEIAVRYVARASERFALRARLYQSAVQLLSKSAAAA